MDWAGERALPGAWLTGPGTFAAEVLGSAGFDWCCADLQHGLIARADLVGMLQAFELGGTTGLVRVPWNHPPDIMWALDAGAAGVIVPMVNDAAQAGAAVRACRFAPAGARSWGPSRAALRGGPRSPAEQDAAALCLVMIETAEAVQRLDEILAVDGVNGVFVGPNDLAVSMGLDPRGSAEHASHHAAIEHILRRCRAHGLLPGIYCSGPDRVTRYRDLGYRLLAVCSDAGLLHQGAARTLVAFRT